MHVRQRLVYLDLTAESYIARAGQGTGPLLTADEEAAGSSIHGARDRRQYSTIREDGAESLQDLSETAGLPKYLFDIQGPGFLFLCSLDENDG